MDSCSAKLLEMIVAVREANKRDKNNNRSEEEKAVSSSDSDSSEWDYDDGEVERRNFKRRPAAGRPRLPRRAKRERKDEPRDDLQNCSGLKLQLNILLKPQKILFVPYLWVHKKLS